MSSRSSFIDCHIKPAFGAAAIVASIAFATLVSPEAFAANPIEEMAKQKIGGGLDPQGDSWLSMQHSLEQFMHPEFILRLFLSLSLAVACAWILDLRKFEADVRSMLPKASDARIVMNVGVTC